jgi:hypothetical protein
MPDPTDLDREERAFRAAFSFHSGDAPDEPLAMPSTAHRRWARAGVMVGAAACVLALVVVPVALSRDDDSDAGPAGPDPTAVDDPDTRWVSFHDVEVAAPRAWAYDYDALRPDCISGGGPDDKWAQDVPPAPYVMVGGENRDVPLIGCTREHGPGVPGAEFGDLPYSFWQPYVKLGQARPDLVADDPSRQDGTWTYDGWTLTRSTISDVQVSVLARPGDSGLGDQVVSSSRRVTTTVSGCDPDSGVRSEEFTRPDGPPVPKAADVAAVAICLYGRTYEVGLVGSRVMTGAQAQDLTRAITDAPPGGGPDQPDQCIDDQFGDTGVALRFFGTEETVDPIGEAFVYFDWCFGNGIVDSANDYRLTRENCAPLFSEPPVTMWSGNDATFDLCHTDLN